MRFHRRLASSRRPCVALFGLLALVAWTACTTGVESVPDEGSERPSSSGGKAPPSASTSTSGTNPPPACTPDPTCDRAACPCDNGEVMAATPCRKNGACDTMGACAAACGGPVKYAESQKACTSDLQCQTSQPIVSCACQEGYGWEAYLTCKDGACSGAKSDVCPSACKDDGGWAGCSGAADCAPLVCKCNDGKTPMVASTCSSGQCAPASEMCPSACTAHGGYKGGTTEPDGGPTGPKQPGESCANASECQPWDCKCKDGSEFKNTKVCSGQVCATEQEACGFTCMNSGGWAGP
jgi:hypothetical protein